MKDKLHIKKHKWPHTFPMVATQHIHVGYVHQCKTATQIPSVLLVLTRQSWLHLQVQSKCSLDPRATVYLFVCFFLFLFFSQGQKKQTHIFPTICSNPWATPTFKAQKPAVILAVQTANTGSTTVDGDTEHLFHASRPCTMDRMAFNFGLWLFKRCKGRIGMKLFSL